MAVNTGPSWIQKARSKMEEKGTVGAFGKATSKKIAAGKKAGGKMKKRTIFAQNMKKISQNRSDNSDSDYA